MSIHTSLSAPLFFIVAIILIGSQAQESRQNPVAPQQQSRLRQANTTTKGQGNNGAETVCQEDLSHMVEVCARPLLNIIEGRMEKWPKSDKDAEDLCEQFITIERCIKDVSRKCAKGLHKTIVSTLATAFQRSRKRECAKGKLASIVKMTNCVEKNQVPMHNMMANITSRISVIEKQFTNVDLKTNGVCCMIATIETEIKALYQPTCPTEGASIVRMYKAVLEDVTELICSRQPKCNDIFKGYRLPKPNNYEGIISLLLRIVFSFGE